MARLRTVRKSAARLVCFVLIMASKSTILACNAEYEMLLSG